MLTAMTLLGAIVTATTDAQADCRCRGSDGTFFELGELACIRTAKGPQLARCEMALNNSSWTVVREDCPEANATPVPRRSATPQAAIALASPEAPHADLH
jgi:hypothetical protein